MHSIATELSSEPLLSDSFAQSLAMVGQEIKEKPQSVPAECAAQKPGD